MPNSVTAEQWKKVNNCLCPSLYAQVEGKKGLDYYKQIATNIGEMIKAKVYQIAYKLFSKEHVSYNNDYAIKTLKNSIKEIQDRPKDASSDWVPDQVLFVAKACSHLKDLKINTPATDAIISDLDAISLDPQIKYLENDLIQDELHKFGSNPKKYFELYESLTTGSNPDPRALFIVGHCYENGVGTDKDTEKAKKYYKKADEIGTAAAMTKLGIAYIGSFHMVGTAIMPLPPGVPPKNPLFIKGLEATVRWSHLAADKGSGVAENALEIFYRRLEKDLDKAIEIYKKKVARGSVIALIPMAGCYEEQGLFDKAVECYKQAADKGNAFAMENLAECYRHGQGVPVDHVKAKELEEQAVKLGWKIFPRSYFELTGREHASPAS